MREPSMPGLFWLSESKIVLQMIPRYFFTFLFPSTALMPLEYCLPLMDVADFVEDVGSVVSYREYIKKCTGVELIIRS